MTGIVLFVIVTALTSLYAFAIGSLVNEHPELAAIVALLVVLMWWGVGELYFF